MEAERENKNSSSCFSTHRVENSNYSVGQIINMSMICIQLYIPMHFKKGAISHLPSFIESRRKKLVMAIILIYYSLKSKSSPNLEETLG